MSTWRSRSISRVRPRDVATGSAPPWKLLSAVATSARSATSAASSASISRSRVTSNMTPWTSSRPSSSWVGVASSRNQTTRPSRASSRYSEVKRLPALLAGGQLRDRAVAVLGMQRLGPAVGILQPLRGRVAQDRFDLRADVAALRPRLVDVHDPRQPLHQQPVALLALAQGGNQPLGVHADHLVKSGRQQAWRGPTTRCVTQRRHDPSPYACVRTKPAR